MTALEISVGSLFSGIGGLDLGLERAGMRVRWQCEIDPYCRAVLGHHWPGLPLYEDIRDIDDTAERVDLICGGFPCQPVSFAGKGLAQKDPRWLWPEFARVVGDLRPHFVLVENVAALVRRGLSDVVGDLASMGYDAEWEIVSASACGAPHLRERIFIVGYPNDEGESACAVDDEAPRLSGVGDTDVFGRDGRARYFTEANWRRQLENDGGWPAEPGVGRVAHGVPRVMDRIRALGNAVVPQVAEAVGRMIVESA